ncbi:MAG: tRNA (N(6)-L-threonylcarbamoyladenosine(37)-C(2))-methylthiotransferase MtaB [Proteobacteria bacterium]|nr:tRNA (N(6)-L-threonylcarbamoyladenosine(37)-C(2))-methylthiotransferase MtaB [Pseudomonadota bacterium]
MADHPQPVDVLTFGCRLNLVESEAIRQAAHAAGRSDLVVVNTCAVTSEAVRQGRQAIRRLKRERPEAEIVVTGCAAETEQARFSTMPEVARIIGNAAKTRLSTWRDLAAPGASAGQIMTEQAPPKALAETGAGHTRGFLQVQTGCDHRCTFCIIPFGRGRARSVPENEVIAATRTLVAGGHADIVLTGVDLTSWGTDLPGTPRLGTLLRAILSAVPDLKRLRLSSIDSIEADPDLLVALAEEERLMPHLHLSLQAGDDLILKRMKRRHSHADAVAFCAEARRLRPDVVFGADIIAGFPTETDAMFARSLDLVAACGITHLHVFPFSPRPGTPAARMPLVAGPVIRDRAARLRAKGHAMLAAHLDRQVGRCLEVLAENGGMGRTRDFTPVRLPTDTPAGTFLSVIASRHDGAALIGDPTSLVGTA